MLRILPQHLLNAHVQNVLDELGCTAEVYHVLSVDSGEESEESI